MEKCTVCSDPQNPGNTLVGWFLLGIWEVLTPLCRKVVAAQCSIGLLSPHLVWIKNEFVSISDKLAKPCTRV